MFCFTKDLVCTMTRAELMAMTDIRTPASFAAAVRELMGQSLLSPKDGALRASWYLGEGFWSPTRKSIRQWRRWCGAVRRRDGNRQPGPPVRNTEQVRPRRPLADG